MRRSRFAKVLAAAAIVVAISGLSFVLTAANTVPDTKAGDGSGTITGYTVSSVKYNLNASNPGNVDSVTFTVDSAPVAGSTLKVQLVSGGTFYTCSNTGTAVTCNTTSPQATVTPANALRVVIAD